VKKGKHIKKSHKVWNKPTFRRPVTKPQARKPRYERVASRKVITWDKYAVVKFPLTTESAIKTIEDTNTLVFIVDRKANKRQIAKACTELYGLKVRRVNTLNRPDGEKKAYVTLQSD
jgi:large subunit ribosomal protein L23Ae